MFGVPADIWDGGIPTGVTVSTAVLPVRCYVYLQWDSFFSEGAGVVAGPGGVTELDRWQFGEMLVAPVTDAVDINRCTHLALTRVPLTDPDDVGTGVVSRA